MREVMQGDTTNPKTSMGNNFRPIAATNLRPIRTNINFHSPVRIETFLGETRSVVASAYRRLVRPLVCIR